MSPTEEFARFLENTAESLGEWTAFRYYIPKLNSLAQRFRQPFNLAIVGRMKTGKSSLINSLIGQRLALSDVEEATATINWICYGRDIQTQHFLVHQTNGVIRSLPLDRIRDFSGKGAETLKRTQETAFLQFFADYDSLKQVQIVDTPGTGSAIQSHETTAQEFLDPTKIEASIAQGSKADAIIYVISPVGRESDRASLEMFEEGRIAGSGPYNSICVLHKWDVLGGDDYPDPREIAAQKAELLASQLEGKVAAVLPVSAPIALAAKTVPDSFFLELLAILKTLSVEELEKLLRLSDRWDRDEFRKDLRAAFELPWSSFSLICRHLKATATETVQAARSTLLSYSRIEDLEKLLELKFFSRLRIIKALSMLGQSARVIKPLIHEMQTQLAEKAESKSILERDIASQSSRGAAWIEREKAILAGEIETLDRVLAEVDRQWITKHAQLELLGNDLKLIEALEARMDLLPEHERLSIIATLNALADLDGVHAGRNGESLPQSSLREMVNRYRVLENTARPKDQRLYAHLVTRMELAISPEN